MNDDYPPTLNTIIILLVLFVLGFYAGGLYKERKMKELVKYCIQERMDIVDCIEEATYVEPADYN